MKFQLFNESTYGKLMNNKEGDFYYYLGDTNSDKWSSELSDILESKEILKMKREDIRRISKLLDYKDIAQYPNINNVVNSRFGHCWFLNLFEKYISGDAYWDICIQMFHDEWYLVNIGDDNGSYNYWYMCDQFDGLKKLIEDKLKFQ